MWMEASLLFILLFNTYCPGLVLPALAERRVDPSVPSLNTDRQILSVTKIDGSFKY